MHSSHKVWITLAVFIVVLAFFVATFFAMSPKKMTEFAKQQQALKQQKQASQNDQEQYEQVSSAETEEIALPDLTEERDLDEEIKNDRIIQEEA